MCVVGCVLLETCCLIFDVSLSVVCCLSLVVGRWLLVVGCCLLVAGRCLPRVV